jgi:phosphatidylinositol alpha-mannosyltransferase
MKRIKIGIVSPYFFPHVGGVSNHVWWQYVMLKKRGLDVKIICPNFGKSEYDCEDVIKLGRPIPLIYNGSLTFISFAFKAGKIIESEKFDIIHVHEPYNPFSLWFLRNSQKSVGTFHVFREEPEKIVVAMGEPFLKLMRKSLSIAIAVSKTAAKIVKDIFKVPEQKIMVVPNGINYELFANAEPLEKLRDGKFNVLFVGRLEPRKGVKHLIRAYRIFKKIVPQSRLIIVGKGMKTYYMSFLTEDIEQNVIFMDNVSSEVLPRIYKSADICVFPSTRGESFGIVILEALASGKPVIAGNAEGYIELLQNGEYGIVVDPRDEDSLARAMVDLYYREDLRYSLAQKGKNYASQFDWKKVIEKIINIYLSDVIRID